MKKVIGFGLFSITIVFPLLSPIGHLLRNIVQMVDTFNYTKTKCLIKGTLMFLSEVIIGCIYLLYLYSSGNSTNSSIQKNEVSNVKMSYDFTFLEQGQGRKKYPKKLYLYLFALSFIDLLTLSLPSLKTNDLLLMETFYELKYSKIIFLTILCSFFLSLKLYRHQFVGITLMIISMSINIITLIYCCRKEIKEEFGIFIISVFLFLFSFFLTSVQLVIEKKLYNIYKISPYELMLYEGLLGFVSVLVVNTFFFFVRCPEYFCPNQQDYNIFTDFMNILNETKVFLFFFLYMTTSLLVNLLARQTIYYFSPTTESVSDSLSSMLFWVIFRFVRDNNKKNAYTSSYIPFIGYCILFFGSLLYNEIIIVYYCGLEENTKREVSIRAGEDCLLYGNTTKSSNLNYHPLHDGQIEENQEQ